MSTVVPSFPQVCVTDNALFIAASDPNHKTVPTTHRIFCAIAVKANKFTDPAMVGFVEEEGYGHNAASRAVPDHGNSWAFYNETNGSEMRVTYKFGPSSVITVGGKTEKAMQDDGWHTTQVQTNRRSVVSPQRTRPARCPLLSQRRHRGTVRTRC